MGIECLGVVFMLNDNKITITTTTSSSANSTTSFRSNDGAGSRSIHRCPGGCTNVYTTISGTMETLCLTSSWNRINKESNKILNWVLEIIIRVFGYGSIQVGSWFISTFIGHHGVTAGNHKFISDSQFSVIWDAVIAGYFVYFHLVELGNTSNSLTLSYNMLAS